MKMSFIVGAMLTFLSLVFISCQGTYYGTAKFCHDSMYLEIFKVNPAGEYDDYLTDSTNFRIYVGGHDPEHNLFSCDCHGDSVIVTKFDRGRESHYRYQKTLSTTVYSLQELRSKHNYH
jgi:hypothetical protein